MRPASSPTALLLALSTLLFVVVCSVTAQTPAGGFTEYPDCVSGPLAPYAICNASLPLLDRATSLVALLNVSEKVTRLGESYGYNGIDRIGLPVYHFRQNAIHGLCCGALYADAGQEWSNSTQFPHVINVAATFNRATMRQLGEVISDEARAFANAGRAGLDWSSDTHSYTHSATRSSRPRQRLTSTRPECSCVAAQVHAQHQHLPRPALGSRPGDSG